MLKNLPLTLFTLLAGAALGYSFQDQKKADQGAEHVVPKPGPEHALLKKLCGEWDAAVHHAGSPPAKATMTTRAHGDFFTLDDFRSDFGGMAFTGHGINGYDPVKKQYVSIWTDTMSPSPVIMWGSYDDKKKELVTTGEGMGPGGKMCKMTNICRIKDDDHMEFEMRGPGPDGKEGQMMRIDYTRKKK
jgi:hypothetical protein